MKFGKKLQLEASHRWSANCLDYKGCKKALQKDILCADVETKDFVDKLQTGMDSIGEYYQLKASELTEGMKQLQNNSDPETVAALASSLSKEITDVRKFTVLNYVAVMKAVKKRNKQLKLQLPNLDSTPLDALELLRQQPFFSNALLAELATQVELIQQEQGLPPPGTPSSTKEYSCPICLDLLLAPVVLTCAHRFCWGCLITHAVTSDPDITGSRQSVLGQTNPPALSRMGLVAAAKQNNGPMMSFCCPMCRKGHRLDPESLQVNAHLEEFMEKLRKRQGSTDCNMTGSPEPTSSNNASDKGTCRVGSGSESKQAPASDEKLIKNNVEGTIDSMDTQGNDINGSSVEWGYLLQPQSKENQGKLTVALDLDGTLITAYPAPPHMPKLQRGVRAHLVGRGSKLNPKGVLVVERPGLYEFLQDISAFCEIVLFTAGLREYAEGVLEAIDDGRGLFSGAVYRDSTVATAHYQFVKDLSYLGRPLSRVVLLDDTPLAFLHQPDNGIPIYGFRGDPDDTLLQDAVLPLLTSLHSQDDVRPTLNARFAMPSWFQQHRYPSPDPVLDLVREKELKQKLDAIDAGAQVVAAAELYHKQAQNQVLKGHGTPATNIAQIAAASARLASGGVVNNIKQEKGVIVMCEVDGVCVEHEGIMRQLVSKLAPELLTVTPHLPNEQQASSGSLADIASNEADRVKRRNEVLREMSDRGVSKADIVRELRQIGSHHKQTFGQLVSSVISGKNVYLSVLSDCDSVSVQHVLAGAEVLHHMRDILGRQSEFVVEQEVGATGLGREQAGSQQQWRHRLVVHDNSELDDKQNGLEWQCREIQAVQSCGFYDRVVLVAQRAYSLLPALQLGPTDVLCVQKGSAADTQLGLIQQQSEGNGGVIAQVVKWNDVEDLCNVMSNITTM